MSPDVSAMSLVEKTVFLKSLEMLSEVSTDALAQLAAAAAELHAKPGDVLFHEGEEDRGTFIVVDGLVELRKGELVVSTLHTGSAHGEFFLEAKEGHQYTGVALEETHLFNIPRDDVISVVLDFPEFGLAMVRAHVIGVRRLTRRVLELEGYVKRCTQALESAGVPIPEPEGDESDPSRA
jgi:CRP-like cAMP-binding protein